MRAGWVLGVLLLTGCSATAQVSDDLTALYYPRHGAPYGTGDMAAVEGALAVRNDCIWLVAADGETFLPIWPSDTKPGVINSLPVILMENDMLVVETGETRIFGGSQTDVVHAEELAGPIPERCAGGSYWVVSTVGR
jgi:hypothetical protein